MKASVVIPTFNKKSRLKLVMDSIIYQTAEQEDFEVIVVDDGSSDGTSELFQNIQLLFPINYKYIKQENIGRAGARNTGILNAKNEIIIFTDDDLIWERNFIKSHIMAQEKQECIARGRIYNLPFMKFFKDPIEGTFYDGISMRDKVKNDLKKERIKEEIINNDDLFEKYIRNKAKISTLENMTKKVLEEKLERLYWLTFVGGNVSVPKKFLLNVNGFDEIFGRTWGCEDVELGYRLMNYDYNFVYVENATNFHIAHYRNDFVIEHAVNLKYFYEKYQDNFILLFQDFIAERISQEEFLQKYRSIRG